MSKTWKVTVPISEYDMQHEIHNIVYHGGMFTWTFPIKPDKHGISVGNIEITFISEEEYNDREV